MLQRTGRSLRPMLWLVAMGVFMQMLDTTIVNTHRRRSSRSSSRRITSHRRRFGKLTPG
jgi:hypothetical protein